MAERIESPLGRMSERSASSPPSPVLDFPPCRRNEFSQRLDRDEGDGGTYDAVHGDGERSVRLEGDGSVGHGTRGEPLDDLVPGLDLLDGDGSRLGVVEVEETSEGDGADLLARVGGVGVVGDLVLLADGVLEHGDSGRVVDVRLSSVTPVVLSCLRESRVEDGVAGGVSSLVDLKRVDGEELKRGSSDSGCGTCDNIVISYVAHEEGGRKEDSPTKHRSTTEPSSPRASKT
jgi:hypothetical protein